MTRVGIGRRPHRPFSADEAAAFIAQPFAEDAVQLRLWDDKGKAKGVATKDVAFYIDNVVSQTVSTQQ